MAELPDREEILARFPPKQPRHKCCEEPLSSWLDMVGEAVAAGDCSLNNDEIAKLTQPEDGKPLISAPTINKHYREHRPELHARMLPKRAR